jgi:stage II sporulation protein D
MRATHRCAILLALLLPALVRAGAIPLIRVGVAPEVMNASLRCDGAWGVGVIGGRGAIEEIPAGATWVAGAEGDRLNVRDHNGTMRGGAEDTLFFFPLSRETDAIQVDGRPYRGEMLVFAAGGGRVTVVDVVDLESYLRGVLPAEIGGGGPDRIEAIKAQAVAARSYTLAYLNRWRTRGFDLLATVEDQVYTGVAGERADTDAALAGTCGVIAVSEGRPIEAYYSSTCGGMTAAPEEVWSRPARSYLKIHRDVPHRGAKAFCSISPQHRWTERWDGPGLEKILKKSLPSALGAKNPDRWGRLRDLRLKSRSESLRVKELEIVFERRTFTIGGDGIRWILRKPGGGSLRSALILKVHAAKRKGRLSAVTIDGAGFGHGIGLCQYGAIGMALDGHDYRKIIEFYYHGARLVKGYDRWPG